MASSFVRRGAQASQAAGAHPPQPARPSTRPGLHGQTLLSTGHADLDRLLGGGLPLGALLLLLEDGATRHHLALARLFLGEGAASGQRVLLAVAEAPAGGLPAFLPALAGASRGGASSRAAVEGGKGGGEEEEEEEEVTLRIAWQYRRYLKGGGGAGGGSLRQSAPPGAAAAAGPSPGRSGAAAAARAKPLASSGGPRDWCHLFDLSKGVGEQAQQVHGSSSSRGSSSGASGSAAGVVHVGGSPGGVAAAAASFCASLAEQQQQVGRVAVLSLGSVAWGAQDAAGAAAPTPGAAVLAAVVSLKASLRGSRCTGLLTVPAGLCRESDLRRLQHVADAVVALESVADDSAIVRLAPDPASVAGLLHLRKLPALGAPAAPVPETTLFLVRHRRRRLSITPMEVDPDAGAAEAGSGGGTRSAAGQLCGGPPSAAKAMDF